MLNQFLGTLSSLDRWIWEQREEYGREYDEIVEMLLKERPERLNADQIRYRFNKICLAVERYL
jgi:hypothetical protein